MTAFFSKLLEIPYLSAGTRSDAFPTHRAKYGWSEFARFMRMRKGRSKIITCNSGLATTMVAFMIMTASDFKIAPFSLS